MKKCINCKEISSRMWRLPSSLRSYYYLCNNCYKLLPYLFKVFCESYDFKLHIQWFFQINQQIKNKLYLGCPSINSIEEKGIYLKYCLNTIEELKIEWQDEIFQKIRKEFE